MERATFGWMQRAWHLATQDDLLALRAWFGHRNGGKQSASIGMPWICEYRIALPHLHDSAEMHHCNAISNVFHHGEIVRNENIGKAQSPLQVAQQIEHLRSDRNIER